MKITIKRKTFWEGLEIVKDSTGKQTALPILKNVKLTAREGTLRLHTTNLSTGTTVLLRDLLILCEGEILCDALKLMAIVKELPESEVRMETDEKGHLIMKCEKSRFRLFAMPPEEFPSEPEILEDQLFPIDNGFFDSLREVKYAALREDTRYNLNGVYIGSDVVATDGHRMAVIRRKLGFDNIIVPLDFVNMILKTRGRKDGATFQAGCSNSTIFLKSEDLVIFGRLIDGEFPDYSQVIPKDLTRYASVERSKLSQAIKRIMLMSGKNFQMKFEFRPFSLVLSSCTPDLGDASEEIKIECRSDTDENRPFAIGLNGRYLLDMLEVSEKERINISMGNELSPIKIEEDESTHILMPLRLSEPQPEAESELKPETEAEIETEIGHESVNMEEVN